MSEQRTRFPLPSEIGDVPGAEGWEELYPYFTRFRPEDDQRFWFYNSMHFPEPMPPFDAITAQIPYEAMGAVTTRVFAFPAALGVDHRILNGRVYITANTVADPAEIAERLDLFQKRAGYYYENWETLYAGWRERMQALLDEIAKVSLPLLSRYEDERSVREARGIAQNYFLREAFHRCIEGYSKMWQYHFEFLMLGYGAYLVFFQFCKKAFPEIADQTVARMVAGVDVLMFRPDEEVKKLAKLALDLGVDDAFAENRAPDVSLTLLAGRGNAGRQWLEAFEQAREPWFHLSTGDGFYHHHRSWNDNLSVPFAALNNYIDMLRRGQSIDRPKDILKQDRERIIAEYRALLDTDTDRAAFDQMLGLSLRVFPFVEDHNFLCEYWYTTLFYNRIREFGELLRREGVLCQASDIFQLRYTEIEVALADVAVGWASGTGPVGASHWQPIVARRKRILEQLKNWDPPPALGPIPDAIEDPAVQMLWGITSETLATWTRAADPLASNELQGLAASPGVVEGIARVINDVNDIGLIHKDEILVCPVTAPSWGAVFSKIKAAVSDIGGTMSHAAIVSREYGLPAVVGTGVATKRIKTGQRLRVDGTRGIVTLLD